MEVKFNGDIPLCVSNKSTELADYKIAEGKVDRHDEKSTQKHFILIFMFRPFCKDLLLITWNPMLCIKKKEWTANLTLISPVNICSKVINFGWSLIFNVFVVWISILYKINYCMQVHRYAFSKHKSFSQRKYLVTVPL